MLGFTPPSSPVVAHDHCTGGGRSVAVVGTGYVGLTTATCLAHLGHRVIGIDRAADKVAGLSAGECPIYETGLEALLHQGLASGRLQFTDQPEAVDGAEVVILCLPTPFLPDGGLDLSYVEAATTTLGPLLRSGAVVATKSTVPIGTQLLVKNWLRRPDIAVVSNPEFLREGTAVDDFLSPDRILIGGDEDWATTIVADLYRRLDAPIVTTDPASAEMVKYAANTFLATKLSFVNEMSRLAEAVGADIADVCSGIGADHRIGSAYLQPGPGWGGSCFPKDTRGLMHIAQTFDVDVPVAAAAYASNQRHLDHIVRSIADACSAPITEARIAVWGAAFKAGTDDVRDSPAIAIIGRLRALGAEVTVFDPAAPAAKVPARTAGDLYSACRQAHVLVVGTEWPEFGSADLDKVAHLMAGSTVVDTRYVIDPGNAMAAGLTLHRPGRPTLDNTATIEAQGSCGGSVEVWPSTHRPSIEQF